MDRVYYQSLTTKDDTAQIGFIKSQIEDKKPYMTFNLTVTGYDKKSKKADNSKNVPMRFIINLYEYNEEIKMYESKDIIDELLPVNKDIIDSLAPEVFLDNNIDKNLYLNADARISTTSAFKDKLTEFIKGIPANTIMLGNFSAKELSAYLSRIDCDVFRDFRHSVLTINDLSAVYFSGCNGDFTDICEKVHGKDMTEISSWHNFKQFLVKDENGDYTDRINPRGRVYLEHLLMGKIGEDNSILTKTQYDLAQHEKFLRNSEEGKERYQSASIAEKVAILKEMGVVKSGKTRFDTFSNFCQEFDNDKTKGFLICQLATLGLGGNNLPIQISIIPVVKTENGLDFVETNHPVTYKDENGNTIKENGKEMYLWNIRTDLWDKDLFEKTLSKTKTRKFDPFVYAGINEDDFRNGNTKQITVEDLKNKLDVIFAKYPTEKYPIISNGANENNTLTFSVDALKRIYDNDALNNGRWYDFGKILMEYIAFKDETKVGDKAEIPFVNPDKELKSMKLDDIAVNNGMSDIKGADSKNIAMSFILDKMVQEDVLPKMIEKRDKQGEIPEAVDENIAEEEKDIDVSAFKPKFINRHNFFVVEDPIVEINPEEEEEDEDYEAYQEVDLQAMIESKEEAEEPQIIIARKDKEKPYINTVKEELTESSKFDSFMAMMTKFIEVSMQNMQDTKAILEEMRKDIASLKEEQAKLKTDLKKRTVRKNNTKPSDE